MAKDILRYSWPNEPVPAGYTGIGPCGITMLTDPDRTWVARTFPRAGLNGIRYGTTVAYLTSKHGYVFEVLLN